MNGLYALFCVCIPPPHTLIHTMLFTLCVSDTDLYGFHHQASLVLWPLFGFGQRETITGYWEVKGEAYWVTHSLCIFTCAWPELWQWLYSIATALVLQFLFCGLKHFLGFGNTIPILVPLDVK